MKPPPADSDTVEVTGQVEPTPSEDDQDTQLYVPFRSWLDARPGRYVHAGAVGLILLQAVVRGWVKFGGWFVADDMSFIGRAEHMPFWSQEYLLAAWNGHFMPGAFALVRVLEDLWPVNYVPVALVDITLQAVAGLLAYRLLVSLFGARPAVLLPLTVFLFSPMTLPAFLWWAAALNQVPGQIAMICALLLQVLYHRSGLTRYGVLGAVAVAAGLLFSEKVLLVVPCVFGLTLLWFTPGRPLARLRRTLRENLAVWVAYLLVVVPYAAYYLTQVPSPVGASQSTTLAVQTVGTALTKAVLPALFGGPLGWQQIGLGGVADPALAFQVATSLGAALVVWISLVRNSRASFGWVVVGGYWAANAILLGITRATYVGPIIGAEYRYSTDVCIIVAVFGTAALLPIVGTARKGQVQRLLPRRSADEQATSHSARQAAPVRGFSMEASTAGALSFAILVLSLVSTFQYDHFWRGNSSAQYFANARDDITASGRHLTISEVTLPERVQNGFLGSFVKTSTMMSGFEPRPSFLMPGRSADELYLPDDSGHLRSAWVDGFHNKPGPEKTCGWRIDRSPVSIPLEKPTTPWQWTVRIGYLATDDAVATVTAGTVTSKVAIQRGFDSIYVLGEGAITSVDISALSAGGMCTNDVTVGFVRPVPGTRPQPRTHQG
jgi:hypothetical protein